MKAAKRVQRLTCLGTDRNHSRYWIFSKATPGLFVEKVNTVIVHKCRWSYFLKEYCKQGWVTDYINYQAEPPTPLNAPEDVDSEVTLDATEESKPDTSGRVTPTETAEITY